MSDLVIRHCEAADIPQVRDLYADETAYADTLQLPYPKLATWEQRLAGGQPGVTSLVAARGDEIVGQLSVVVCDRPRRKHVATFGMGVKASARGSGVGSALLVAAIDLCEKWLNVSRLEIEVYTDNAAAIALYKRHGFALEGTCKQYAFRDGRYVDAHVMARLRAD